MRNIKHLAAIAAVGMACAAPFPASAAEAPTVTTPTVLQGEPPAMALVGHAKRVGGVAFNLAALEPPPEARMQEGESLRVQACNAAGCGAYSLTAYIPATGTGCGPIGP